MSLLSIVIIKTDSIFRYVITWWQFCEALHVTAWFHQYRWHPKDIKLFSHLFSLHLGTLVSNCKKNTRWYVPKYYVPLLCNIQYCAKGTSVFTCVFNGFMALIYINSFSILEILPQVFWIQSVFSLFFQTRLLEHWLFPHIMFVLYNLNGLI